MISQVVVVFKEEVRVVATLAQLHHEVVESCFADLAAAVGKLKGCFG